MIDVIAHYFDELIGIFEWSRRSSKERWQTVGAWTLLLVIATAGYVFFSKPTEA